MALSSAVKVINCTTVPSGMVSTLLVFGVLPRPLLKLVGPPPHVQRIKALNSAREEASKQIVQARLETALAENVSLVAERNIYIRNGVLVF